MRRLRLYKRDLIDLIDLVVFMIHDKRRYPLRYTHTGSTVRAQEDDRPDGREPISKSDVLDVRIALETEETMEAFLERV